MPVSSVLIKFCNFPLRKRITTLSIVTLFFSCLDLISLIVLFSAYPRLYRAIKYKPLTIVLSLVNLIRLTLLLFGIHHNKHRFLLPYIILECIIYVYAFIILALDIGIIDAICAFLGLFIIIVQVYFFNSVINYYLKMKQENHDTVSNV